MKNNKIEWCCTILPQYVDNLYPYYKIKILFLSKHNYMEIITIYITVGPNSFLKGHAVICAANIFIN